MENVDFFSLFQGFGTMVAGGWILAVARVFLITLGGLLVYLGWKGVLEPMVMIDGTRNGCNQLWYFNHAGRCIR